LPWLQFLGKALLQTILQPHYSGFTLGCLDLGQCGQVTALKSVHHYDCCTYIYIYIHILFVSSYYIRCSFLFYLCHITFVLIDIIHLSEFIDAASPLGAQRTRRPLKDSPCMAGQELQELQELQVPTAHVFCIHSMYNDFDDYIFCRKKADVKHQSSPDQAAQFEGGVGISFALGGSFGESKLTQNVGSLANMGSKSLVLPGLTCSPKPIDIDLTSKHPKMVFALKTVD
jgi:hypothetical protein